VTCVEDAVLMTPERWHEIDRLFQAALGREPSERVTFLDEACSGDGELRKEVEYLISYSDREDCLLDAPAVDAAAGFLALNELALDTGQHLSHYEILDLLGIGGMGEVYLAQDKKLSRKVALKLLPADYTRDEARLHRFQQEAQAASEYSDHL
jgi:eukaryotic-like serine/threonine-protein kinase